MPDDRIDTAPPRTPFQTTQNITADYIAGVKQDRNIPDFPELNRDQMSLIEERIQHCFFWLKRANQRQYNRESELLIVNTTHDALVTTINCIPDPKISMRMGIDLGKFLRMYGSFRKKLLKEMGYTREYIGYDKEENLFGEEDNKYRRAEFEDEMDANPMPVAHKRQRDKLIISCDQWLEELENTLDDRMVEQYETALLIKCLESVTVARELSERKSGQPFEHKDPFCVEQIERFDELIHALGYEPIAIGYRKID